MKIYLRYYFRKIIKNLLNLLFFYFFKPLFLFILKMFNTTVQEFKLRILHIFYSKEIKLNKIIIDKKIGLIPERLKIIKDEYVLFGPWTSEVGFELLYWIPYLKKNFNLQNKKIIIISRGGVENWYRFSNYYKYFNLLDLASNSEIKKHFEIKKSIGGQKQFFLEDFDKKIIERLKEKLGINSIEVIHPKEMYNFFKPYWAGLYSFGIRSIVENKMKFYDLDKIDLKVKNFVACKLYSSSILNIEKNKEIFSQKIKIILNEILKKYNIIFLDFETDDDHQVIDLNGLNTNENKFFFLKHLVKNINIHNNLQVQSKIVNQSEFFLGTYGGFAYLPSYYNKHSVGLWNDNSKLIFRHQSAFEAFQLSKDKMDILNLNYPEDYLKDTIKSVIMKLG